MTAADRRRVREAIDQASRRRVRLDNPRNVGGLRPSDFWPLRGAATRRCPWCRHLAAGGEPSCAEHRDLEASYRDGWL